MPCLLYLLLLLCLLHLRRLRRPPLLHSLRACCAVLSCPLSALLWTIKFCFLLPLLRRGCHSYTHTFSSQKLGSQNGLVCALCCLLATRAAALCLFCKLTLGEGWSTCGCLGAHVPYEFRHQLHSPSFMHLSSVCSVRTCLGMHVHCTNTRSFAGGARVTWTVHLRNRRRPRLLRSSVIEERGGACMPASLVSMALRCPR